MTKKYLLLLPIFTILSGCVGLAFDNALTTPETPSHRTAARQVRKNDTVHSPTRDEHHRPKRDEQPANTVDSDKSVAEAISCLKNQIEQSFHLPKDFYTIQRYDDGAATVRLVNPHTKTDGLFIDAESRKGGSTLRIYANRSALSTAWKRLPEKCR